MRGRRRRDYGRCGRVVRCRSRNWSTGATRRRGCSAMMTARCWWMRMRRGGVALGVGVALDLAAEVAAATIGDLAISEAAGGSTAVAVQADAESAEQARTGAELAAHLGLVYSDAAALIGVGAGSVYQGTKALRKQCTKPHGEEPDSEWTHKYRDIVSRRTPPPPASTVAIGEPDGGLASKPGGTTGVRFYCKGHDTWDDSGSLRDPSRDLGGVFSKFLGCSSHLCRRRLYGNGVHIASSITAAHDIGRTTKA